jgi:hypothetical protein
MDPQEIAELFAALHGGEVRDLTLQDGHLQFRVYLPRLAALRGEGFDHFLCVLADAGMVSLQPFRNDSTELRDLKQIEKLQLRIESAEAGVGDQVKVFCAHRAGGSGARLSLRGSRFSVYDEAFDALSVAELGALRAQAVRE